MKRKIIDMMKKTNTLPFLFVGSGLSRRYLGLENWEGLLSEFADRISDNEFAYNIYKQRAEVQKYNSGLLPKIAELIENDFNQVWFEEKKFSENRERHRENITKGVSPLKIEIGDYMISKSANIVEEYKAEIDLFRQIGNKSVAGFITTNYDLLLESLFGNFKKYIGQEELIFSQIQGISEIYKIHGCASKPESIVINEKDYNEFADKYAYLAAKLLTIFLEHPIIFIGYSISDKNIENILKAIVQCLSQEHLERLKERLLFVEWCQVGEEDISIYSKSFEGEKSIDMTRIKLNDFSILYEALIENKAKYNVSILRQIKEDIYNLVIENKPTGTLRVIGLEDDDALEQVEIVIGVGVLSEFGQKGYLGVSADELYEDVILDNGNFDSERIIHYTLPILLPRNSGFLPIYKYLAGYEKDVPDLVKSSVKTEYDQLLSKTIKKNRVKHVDRNSDIKTIIQKYSLKKCLQIIPHMKPENLELEQLHCLLRRAFEEIPDVLGKNDQALRSDMKRVIRIYDFLKFKYKK